ncbi:MULTISPECIES: F0F1 ATP synthase subunit epsilon [Nioella]|jgi:F-type H+-transporting ATPase subunit epsilon|uniref:F0F1 ATP synthase subunit epsilon n=1 Tax=Nioella TaxID=1775424 RepID=UPI000FDA4E95|nr:F0F1 ATP synthase subunit epsilon [Nioella ostreopsis]
MADMMQFDLVSPEKRLASFEASSVQIPGADGDLTAMPGHSPVITTLRPGVVRVQSAEGDKSYVVTSGFVEVTAGSVSVIAERAHAGDEVRKDDLSDLLEEARAKAASAEADQKDGAEKFVADLVQLLEDME